MYCKMEYQYKVVKVNEWLDIKCWQRSEKRERDHPGLEVKKGLELLWKFVRGKERQGEATGVWVGDLMGDRHSPGKRQSLPGIVRK